MFENCRCRRLSLALLLAAALVGCGEAESITTQEVERTEPRPRPIDVEQERDRLDHMLTAIVPQGERAWFFKLVARGDEIEPLRKPFEEFVASVKPGEGGARPTWNLPEGWEEKPGDAMRVATIEVPAGGRKLPLAVSTLPLSGEWDKFVERNVTRWLGQLQQPPLPAGKTAKLARKTPIEGGEATIIELVGTMEQTGGMMPAGHPPVGSTVNAAGPPARRESPATPVEPAGTAAPPPREFNYEAPAGWQPGPLNAMRKAAFVISEGGQQAEVTVMPFPASGPMADSIAQAQRWAGQVGLPMSEAELKAAEREVTIDGLEGRQFELLGPDPGERPLGAIAAMVQRGDQMWFFKMMGDRAVVEKQRDAFARFLQSVKFTAEAE